MLLDSAFLTKLRDLDSSDWPWELADRVETSASELVGVLWTRNGRPFALSWAETLELHKGGVSPGALIGDGVWFGADAGLAFHTQVTRARAEPTQADLDFAKGLRDLFRQLGSPAWLDHLFIASDGPTSLSTDIELLDDPQGRTDESEDPEEHAPDTSADLKVYRQPVTGEVWVAKGPQPPWLRDALAKGFALDDFELPSSPPLDTPGVPHGSRLVRGVSLDLADRPPVESLQEIVFPGYLDGVGMVDRLAEGLRPLIQSLEEPCVGAVFVQEDGLVTAPRAGWLAPAASVWEQPAILFRTAHLDPAAWVVSFSTDPDGAGQDLVDLVEPLRRLRTVGELLGTPVRDHLVLDGDGGSVSIQRRSVPGRPLDLWPALSALDRFSWPPARHENQRKWVLQHPEDGRVWSRRGTPPPWVEELEAQGWDLATLYVYR